MIELFHATVWQVTRQSALAFVQEQHALLFQYRALQMQFNCEHALIGWNHIDMIALMMAEASHQGWQGPYRLTLLHRAQGLVMTAGLKALWYGAGC